MTPKEKAKDIFSKYMPELVNELGMNDETYELNRNFALITVNEITNIKLLWFQKDTKELDYWNEVAKEIAKL